MKITVQSAKKSSDSPSLYVIPAYTRGPKGASLDADWKEVVPKSVQGPLRNGDFKGTLGSHTLVHTGDGRPGDRVLFVGLGAKGSVDATALRRYGGIAGGVARKTKGEEVVVTLPTAGKRLDRNGRARFVAEGLALGSYRFDGYRAGDGQTRIESATLITADASGLAATKRAVESGLDLAAGVNLARDVGNTPANDLGPVELADRAKKMAKDCGLDVTILDQKAIEREKMGALLGVAQGSARPARFIVLEHQPKKPDGRAPLVFVGKAITFDTGGISIKPAGGMADMKYDMCGGGAVLGAMAAIGKLQPKRRVIGLIPSAENMPGAAAYRPGDILKSRSGKTIEVLNTDAEGRLALADGLDYALQYEPALIVDVATLTGACVVGLGRHFSGAFSHDAKLCQRVVTMAGNAAEPMWPMPVTPEYVKQIRSTIADYKNVAGRYGGAITAAAFLSQFVGDTPWVHLDIAGTGDAEREHDLGPRGATGVAVRTLVELAERF